MSKDTISIEKKVLMSIDMALKTHGKCTFSELVKQAFTMYPDDFVLAGYKKWPDSVKLDRPLRKLRHDGFITGGASSEFLLTQKGVDQIEEIKNISSKEQLFIDFSKQKKKR